MEVSLCCCNGVVVADGPESSGTGSDLPPGGMFVSVEQGFRNFGDTVLAIAGLGWYFFAPRKGHLTELGEGVQKIAVTVRAGYSPDWIHARPGIPLEIEFDRQ